jgi:hypothetical protein
LSFWAFRRPETIQKPSEKPNRKENSMSNIKITAIITVKAEHRAELLDVFTALVGESRKEGSNLRYDLHQDLQNPNRLVFFENWKDQAAVDSHNASVHFQNFLKAIDGKTEAVDIVLMKDVSDNGN